MMTIDQYGEVHRQYIGSQEPHTQVSYDEGESEVFAKLERPFSDQSNIFVAQSGNRAVVYGDDMFHVFSQGHYKGSAEKIGLNPLEMRMRGKDIFVLEEESHMLRRYTIDFK
jgi:hypothetical protein